MPNLMALDSRGVGGDLPSHEKSDGASFSDTTLVGLILIGFSSPLSLTGLRDVYLVPSVIVLTLETVRLT